MKPTENKNIQQIEKLEKENSLLRGEISQLKKSLDSHFSKDNQNEARIDSERLYRLLLTASSEVLYRMSPDWSEMLQLNSRGFLTDTGSANPNWLQEYIHPDDQPYVKAVVEEAVRKKSTFELEHRVLRADGSWGWTLSRAVPLLDSKGEIMEWFGSASDFTKRKQAEDAIQRSEAILKQAGTMASLGAWEIELINTEDNKKNPLHWSDQVYRIFGYEPGSVQVTNEMFFDHVHPDDRQKISDAVAKAVRGRNIYSIEHRIKRADGAERIVVEHAEISTDKAGRPVRIIGAIQDITERKLEEEILIRALSEAEEGRNTLMALMEYIPIGITIADPPDVNIRMVSRYGQEILEKSSNEVPGIPGPENPSESGVYRADGITPGAPEELPLSRATLKGEIVKNEALYVTRKDGTLIPILCNAAPILDKDGKVIGGIIGWQDIAELKRIERELQNRNEELNRFIYTVSHDLKSPLVTIKMFTLYLREDLKSQDNAALDKDLGYIENATDKMGKLLEELLELSRIGRKEDPASEILLETVVQNVIDLLAGRIRDRKAKIYISAPPVMLYGHPQRLAQIYQNLLDNALKFMGNQPEPLVEIGAFIDKDRNNEVVLFVRDNGSGIDQQYEQKVFGLFEKLEAGTEGTGIGLSLVKRIVEVHEGKIWFTSEGMNKGTTFYFTLRKTRILNQ